MANCDILSGILCRFPTVGDRKVIDNRLNWLLQECDSLTEALAQPLECHLKRLEGLFNNFDRTSQAFGKRLQKQSEVARG